MSRIYRDMRFTVYEDGKIEWESRPEMGPMSIGVRFENIPSPGGWFCDVVAEVGKRNDLRWTLTNVRPPYFPVDEYLDLDDDVQENLPAFICKDCLRVSSLQVRLANMTRGARAQYKKSCMTVNGVLLPPLCECWPHCEHVKPGKANV